MRVVRSVKIDRVEQVSPGRNSEYKCSISDGEHSILVKVSRVRRKTLGLDVGRGQTELRVPTNCPWSEIRLFLADQFDWILSTQDEIASRPRVADDSFIPGGSVSYLGEAYRLDVIKSRFSIVAIEGSDLYVSCSNPNSPKQIERHVMRWLRSRAEAILAGRVSIINEQFQDARRPSSLKIRKMRARWGSCSELGEICFNLMLIREHLPQIDYVVAHELCHLRHFEHNSAFYRLLDEVMPDWRKREELLKS